MQSIICAAIDPVATGRNILKLRMERNLSVRDIQRYFHFDEPRAIYKWQTGKSLPNLDNLYALSVLFKVPMDRIIVGNRDQIISTGPQEESCGSVLYCPRCEKWQSDWQIFGILSPALQPRGARAQQGRVSSASF